MRKILILLHLVALCADVYSQAINQSVQVTNQYESSFTDFQKQATSMQVHDSLYSFNYHFDYSVFDTPYRGSYEFEPYQVGLKLDTISYAASKFYMRLGAGYVPRPEMYLAWNPIQEAKSGLSIFNSFKSRIAAFTFSDGFSDYDFSDNFRLHSRKEFNESRLDFAAAYDGIFSRIFDAPSTFNSLSAKLNYSTDSFFKLFASDIEAQFRYSIDYLPIPGSTTNLTNFYLKGRLSPIVDRKASFILDYHFETDNLSDSREGISTQVRNYAAVSPKFNLKVGQVEFNLGAKFDCSMSPDFEPLITPAIDIDWDWSAARMHVYMAAIGGQSINSYYNLKSLNHFYTLNPLYIGGNANMMSTRINAYLGMKGFISNHFSYDLKGGYKDVEGLPLDAMPSTTTASLGFVRASIVYASLTAKYFSDRFDMDACAEYNVFKSKQQPDGVFAPAAIRAELRGRYNWLRRTYLGVSAEFSSARTSLSELYPDIPAWCDLGLYAEYYFKPSFAMWLKAANLLCSRIERQPGFVESDPYLTLGLTLKF